MSDFQFFSLLLSAVAILIASATFWRLGKWRETDDGKLVNGKLSSSAAEIMKLDMRLGATERVHAEMSAVERRLTVVETSLQHVASRGDIQEVKAEVQGLDRTVRNVEAATVRIETYLMDQNGKSV